MQFMILSLAALQANSVNPAAGDALTGLNHLAQATANTLPAASHDGFSLLQLMLDASLPVQLIMTLLIAASIVSWVIIFHKRRVMARTRVGADRFEEWFWSSTDLNDLSAGVPDVGPAVGMEAIFEAGLLEFGRLRQRNNIDTRIQMEGAQRAMRATGSREINGLEHNLELLANIGSTAPYIGLVGTVFGIMVTMHGLLGSGAQVGIKDVAPGISEALLATVMGLFVAIPAVWGYNRFASGVERLAVRYDAFAEEFSSILQRQAHADE